MKEESPAILLLVSAHRGSFFCQFTQQVYGEASRSPGHAEMTQMLGFNVPHRIHPVNLSEQGHLWDAGSSFYGGRSTRRWQQSRPGSQDRQIPGRSRSVPFSGPSEITAPRGDSLLELGGLWFAA